jgi:hypothetical protein
LIAAAGANRPSRRRCGRALPRGRHAFQYMPPAFTRRVTNASPDGRNSQSAGGSSSP